MTARRAALVAALASIATIGGGCAPHYVGGARPIDPDRIADEPGWLRAGPTPTLRQRHADDCGPAALAMVASHWQVPLTVDEATAALPEPGPLGARLRDLRDAARARGLVAFVVAGDRATIDHELRAGRPLIVGLLLPYSGKQAISHYEVVVAASAVAASSVAGDGGQVVTIDPSSAGWRVRTYAALDAEWAPVGRPTLVVLGLEPAAPASR